MSLPVEELTPRQIVAELDRYIVGQDAAKRAVAVALRNRYRRQQLPEGEREDILPKNILMIGPTGVGKTEIARRLAQLARAPFIKLEATKFTEVGYVGRDVDSMIRDLVSAAVRLVERERFEEIQEEAARRAMDRLVDLLFDGPYPTQTFSPFHGFGGAPPVVDDEGEAPEEEVFTQEMYEAHRAELRYKIESGQMEDRLVEVDVEESNNPFMQVFTNQGIEEMGIDTNQLGGAFGTRRSTRRVTVAEAKDLLTEQEASKMVDRSSIYREAINRTEQTGIVFLDEIDKVAAKSGGSGPDVSREGVQRDLLPVIEGSTVATKFGPVRTDHILFIAAGAFHISKPSDLIPELQGRLPIRVELESLSQSDFRRILKEPKNALTKQYIRLLEMDGVQIRFEDDALDEIANFAAAVNERVEDIGARRLHTVMEWLLHEILFEAPETEQKIYVFDGPSVRQRLESTVNNVALSRNVL